MTEISIKLRDCPVGAAFHTVCPPVAPAFIEQVARQIAERWDEAGAWMLSVSIDVRVQMPLKPATEKTATLAQSGGGAQRNHVKELSESIDIDTKPIAKPSAPPQPTQTATKARTTAEALIAVRRALPNVGDRVQLRAISQTVGAGYQSLIAMDGIRTPFRYIPPADRTGPDRFAYMERVRPDDPPGSGRTVHGSRGVKIVTHHAVHEPEHDDGEVSGCGGGEVTSTLDRVARLQRERAERIAREGTDEPAPGMNLSDGRKPANAGRAAARPSSDLDDDVDHRPIALEVESGVLQRLLQIMPRVGDSVALADCFADATHRMTARQICRTDRRFKLGNGGQTARRKEL